MSNKHTRITSLLVFVGLFAVFSFTAAITIPNPLGGTNNFCTLLTNIGNKIGQLIGGLGSIMLIIAGIMFVFSAGNTGMITKAKSALLYAIIGMVIGFGASVIVSTVKDIINASGGSC